LPEESTEEMVDKEKTYDLLMNKFKYRSIFDKRVYKDDNTQRLLSNYSALLFTLGRSLRMEVITAPFVLNPQTYEGIVPNEKQKEILKKTTEVFLKGLSYTDDERIWATIMIELRAILKVLNEPDYAMEIISKLEKENPSSYLLFLKGEIYRSIGDISNAEAYYKKAMEDSKKDPAIYYSYLKLQLLKGDTSTFNTILSEAFKDQQLLGGIFGYANALGDTSLMIEILKFYMVVNPYDTETKSYLDSLTRKYYRMRK
jgi:tetratricopeptide (TPR) repeat protein